MKNLIIAAALLGLCAPASAQPARQALEEDYDWRSVAVDRTRGVAVFVTERRRAGDAVLFQVLKVHRDVLGRSHPRFDKELNEMLADCGSRMLLQFNHRNQVADLVQPPQFTYAAPPEVPKAGSEDAVVLTAACGEGQDGPIVADPYGWAKARLRGTHK
ncbi:MAG TPA: hypothetical protein VF605_11525 [Allosphingosinicella sp.]